MSIERQLVATLANNPELIGQVSVTPDEFTDYRAGVIFGVVSDLIEKQKTPDSIMVAEMIEFSRGESWLGDVVDAFSYIDTPKNFSAAQERVKGEARKRNLERAGRQFLEDLDVNSLMSSVEKIEGGSTNLIQSGSSVMAKFLVELDALHRCEKKPGVTTGFYDLDYIAGGLVPGDSIVVAARTSVGKTAFMCNLATNCGVPCGIISGEQSSTAIIRRLTAKLGSLSMQKLKTGQLSDFEFSQVAKAAEKIGKANLHIVDKSRPSISEVEQYARTMHWQHGIQVLFVDYLQLISNSLYPNDRRLQVADISARLKKLAKDLQIPVVTLAQLNRGAVDHKPRISDLKESGAIEEDADQIMILFKDPEADDYVVTVDVQKNREGATGETRLLWKANTMTFENLSNEF